MKLEELKGLFMEEARKYNVLPLDDRRVELQLRPRRAPDADHRKIAACCSPAWDG
jgi:hypothetical protein